MRFNSFVIGTFKNLYSSVVVKIALFIYLHPDSLDIICIWLDTVQYVPRLGNRVGLTILNVQDNGSLDLSGLAFMF